MFLLEGSPLTTLEAHEALNTTFAKFSLTNESREGILDVLKQLFPKASLPKDAKHLVYSKDRITNIAETNGKYYTFDCCASCHEIVFVSLYSDYQRGRVTIHHEELERPFVSPESEHKNEKIRYI